MDAKEFAKKMVTDEAFMIEVTRELPDDGFAKKASQDVYIRGLLEYAEKQGWNMDEGELKEAYNKAIEGLGFIGALKFAARFSRVAKAAGKGKEELRARGVQV